MGGPEPVDSLLPYLHAIESASTDRPIGHGVAYFPIIGSTNTAVAEALRADAPSGLVVVADEQYAGRGRSGRGWTIPPGAGLLVSTGIRPALPLDRAWLLGAWAAVAAVRAIRTVTGLAAVLKWPNDIRLGRRKVGGVLVETTVTGGWVVAAAVGIGLNVNLDRAALAAIAPEATSLSVELGRPIWRGDLLFALIDELNVEAGAVLPADPTAPEPVFDAEARRRLRTAWVAYTETVGQPIWVHEPTGRWSAEARAIADDGALVVVTPTGEQRHIYAADVSIRDR